MDRKTLLDDKIEIDDMIIVRGEIRIFYALAKY